MMNEPIRVSRQQLYDQVWSKPIRQLAKGYGLSDVGLSKLCRLQDIPLPPTGYWMKVQHGLSIGRPPLPPAKPGQPEIIEILLKQEQTLDLDEYPELKVEYEAIKRKELQSGIPKSPKDLHPLLKHAQEVLKKCKHDSDGRTVPLKGSVDILVSPPTLDRAVGIMHALFRVLESQGFSVSVREEERNGTFVKILGEELRISLKERAKRTEKVQTSQFDHKYEFHRVGTLFIETMSYYAEGVQHKWEDRPSSLLEDKLLDISEGLIQIALRRRIKQLEWDEVRRKKEEEQQRLQAEERRRNDEEARFKRLIQDATDWQTSNTIRSYLDAVRASLKGDENLERKADLQRWLEWAELKAEELDPLGLREIP